MARTLRGRFRKANRQLVFLRYAERSVGVEAVLQQPSVMVLTIEDVCTRFAHDDWRRRKPTRRRPWARRRWEAEGAQLRAKVQRIRELAAQCLDGAE